MWRATLSSLLAHKLRLALTALAIVLGVAFISGTFILTDTLRASFESVFGQITANVDLSVRGVSALDEDAADPFSSPPPVVPAEIADEVATVDGVAAVERNVEGVAQLVDTEGEPIGNPQQGPPTLGFAAPVVEELAPSELRSGAYPSAADQVAIDAATARTNGFAVGDDVQIAANGPIDDYEVAGIFGFAGGVDNLGGASVVLFEPDTAFALFARDDGYESVDVLADDDADVGALADRLSTVVGRNYEVVTSDELAAEQQQITDTIIGFLGPALLVFAGVSLLVGAFIINNTFAIIVAQRTRELALLRAVGASRGQVLRSVLLEALVVGVLASAIGVLAGAVIAIALRGVLAAFSLDLPEAALVFNGRTIVVGMAIGVAVTLVSVLLPALKAVRVPPVAAMQTVATPPSRRRGIIRTVIGVVLAGAGVAMLAIGLSGDAGFPVVVGGAVALLLGSALLARFVTRPLLAVVGWPVARLGIRGTLAQENAVRNPQRTASTASALMIGVGLVTFALIMGSSLRSSINEAIDEQGGADLLIFSGQAGMPSEIADVVGDVEGVGAVTPERSARMAVGPLDDRVVSAVAIPADGFADAYTVDFVDGSVDDLASGGVLVRAEVADEAGLAVGDVVPVTFAETGQDTVVVRGIYEADQGFVGDWFIDADTHAAITSDDSIVALNIAVDDGASVAATQRAVADAVDGYPGLDVQNREDLKEQVSGGVDQLLGLVSALLALSILIALFGITNTLSLSVFERVRELGLLRAVGATRRQVRSIIRWESVLIAVLGAVFGVAVGAVFGWMTVQALADEGLSTFAFPTGQVVIAVAVAAIAGMLSAILPARRAARVDVLRALAAN